MKIDFISSNFSAWTFGDSLVPSTGFSFRSFPFRGVSWSIETRCSTAFLFQLLLVILEREEENSLEVLKFFKEKFCFSTERFRNSKRLCFSIYMNSRFIYFLCIICSPPRSFEESQTSILFTQIILALSSLLLESFNHKFRFSNC